MALYDAPDALKRVKNKLRRPASDTAFTRDSTDDRAYEAMTEANDHIIKLIATYIPDAMVTAPTELTSADSGKTYTFGTQDSVAIFALGHFKLYENLESIPDYPLVEGVDYVIEGTRIRIPYNQTRTFTDGGPYAQSVTLGTVVSAAANPTCPLICRLALIEDTCRRLAPLVGLDQQEFADNFDREWGAVLAAVRTAGFGKGGRKTNKRYPRYWFGR